MKNQRIILAVVVTVATVWVCAMAQEKPAEDPYVLAAIARAKAEVAIRDSGPITDTSRNGFNNVWQETDEVWGKIWDRLGTARDAESRKDEYARNQQFIDECNTKLDTLNREWQSFNQKERQELGREMQDAINEFNNLSQAFASLSGQEQYYKNAKLDLLQVITMYNNIEKKIIETRNRINATIAKAKEFYQKWEKVRANVEEFLTKAGYAPQQPASGKTP